MWTNRIQSFQKKCGSSPYANEASNLFITSEIDYPGYGHEIQKLYLDIFSVFSSNSEVIPNFVVP